MDLPLTPRMVILEEKKLVGMHLKMCLDDHKVANLWSAFMPKRNQITNAISGELISMAIYGKDYFRQFNPSAEFEKWAAVEVSNVENPPPGLRGFILSSGIYAVFDYKGSANDPAIYQFIFTQWLPASEYQLDDRPHFEILGSQYNNESSDSEEEIWIPVKPKHWSASFQDGF